MANAGSESAAREALIEQILQRQEQAQSMPAWQNEPRVNAHIADLYAYLSARAQGTQGPGRPAPQHCCAGISELELARSG